jgi:23S rRNA pseudouridine955/2504/2580 synthase
MRERRLVKRYLALVNGEIREPEIWEDLLIREGELKITRVISGESPGLPAGAPPGAGRGAGGGPSGPETARAKPARTRVFPLTARSSCSLIALEIDTGRTHQIRAQAGFHGHPLTGDGKYGGGPRQGGLLLHSWSLEFPPCPDDGGPAAPDPAGGQTALQEQGMAVTAPLPELFRRRIRELFGETCLDYIDTNITAHRIIY